MTELEKVEKLREKANVSFSEAKEALEAAGGDILDALIYLENNGRAIIPPGGGYFSGDGANGAQYQHHSSSGYDGRANQSGESFGNMMKRFGRFCLMLLRKGNSNFLEAAKGGQPVFSCPVTIVVLFLVFFFWVTVPLFVISLFFGVRYRFRGSELGRDSVNNVMDSASNVVDEVKKTLSSGINSEGANDSNA